MQEELGGQDGRCEKQKGAGAGEAARADAAGGERVARLSHGAAHVVGDVDGPTALAAHKWHAWYYHRLGKSIDPFNGKSQPVLFPFVRGHHARHQATYAATDTEPGAQ